MLVLLRFDVGVDVGWPEPEFIAQAEAGLAALSTCRGYRRGQLGRGYDDPAAWCLLTEWDSVGAYRRALHSYEVKVRATPLLARCRPEASAFEPLASAAAGGPVVRTGSDLAGADGCGEGRLPSRP